VCAFYLLTGNISQIVTATDTALASCP